MINNRKTLFILFLTLILMILPLSSCTALKTSSSSMEGRTKILQDNQEQYTQFAEVLLENVTRYSQEISEHSSIYIQPNDSDQVLKKEDWYVYYFNRAFSDYNTFLTGPSQDSGSRYDPATSQKLDNTFENLLGAAEIQDFLLDHPVYIAGADQGSNTAYVSLYENRNDLFFGKSKPEVPKAKIQDIITFRFYAEGNAVDAKKYDPNCSVLNDHWVILSAPELEDHPTQRTYEKHLAFHTTALKDLSAEGFTLGTTKQTTIELPFLSTVKQWTEESSMQQPKGLEYIYEINEDEILLIYERKKQINAVLLNWRTGQTIDQINFTQGLQDYPAYFLERLNETTFACVPRQAGFVAETMTLFTVKDHKIAELYSVKLPKPALWRQSRIHFISDLSLCAYIDEEKNSIQVCQVGKNGELIDQKTYLASELDTNENIFLQQLKFVDQDQLIYTWSKKIDNEQERRNSEGFTQLELITNQTKAQVSDGIIQLKESPGMVWVDSIEMEAGSVENSDSGGLPSYVRRERLFAPNQVRQIDHPHFAPFGENVFFSSQGEFFASRTKMSSAYVINPSRNFPLAFAWYHLPSGEWEKEFWLVDYEDVLQSPSEYRTGVGMELLGDNSLLAATSSYAQRMYFVSIKGDRMVLKIVEKP